MDNNRKPTFAPPLPPGYRASGLLVHVTSLATPYGIGDVGPVAMAWVDRLRDAGQGWWQALPLGPTGYGDSPYQPLSSFAGNWLLLSPEALTEDGLLTKADMEFPVSSAGTVNYNAVTHFKRRMVEIVADRFEIRAKPALKAAYEEFRAKQDHWLEDYALFRR